MPARRFVYLSCAESKEIWVFAMAADGALRGLGRVPVRGTDEPSSSSMPPYVRSTRGVADPGSSKYSSCTGRGSQAHAEGVALG